MAYPLRVLLLEADPEARAAMRALLAAAGMSVIEGKIERPEETAVDADACIISSAAPDAHIARTALAALRERMPVLMLTAASDHNESDHRTWLRAGATDCRVKTPSAIAELPATLRTLVRLARNRDHRHAMAVRCRRSERGKQHLLDGERVARAEAESSRRRLAFLAQASTVLGQSLDYQTTLASGARLCVPDLADWCTVDIRSADGRGVQRLAVAHVDPSKVEHARELDRRYPLDLNDQSGVSRVMRSGQSELVSEIRDEMLISLARDAEHLRIMRELGFKSGMVVPLVARGNTLGAISFIIAESDYRYGPQDLALAEDLARRAALAVDNARLYRDERQSEQHFKAVFDQAAMGIGEADRNGRFLLVNQRFCQMLGYSLEELRQLTIRQVTHPDDWPQNKAAFDEAVASGKQYDMEKRYIRKDGSALWVHLSVSWVPHGGADGDGFALAIVEDINDRKQAQDELRQAKLEAEAANASKDQFLAVLSHELRTPLTPVLTMVQVMEADDELPGEQRQAVEMIRRNVEMEARLIDDLLDLTRIAKGKLQLSLQTVDAHATLRTALEICRSDMSEKSVGMKVELSAGDYHVRADPARLQQVFWNLIKNAVKFTPAGGQITVRTSNQPPGQLCIDVCDTGIGIEPENLARIFYAFEQGEQSITRQFGGLGLGLSISKSLIDMHGGHLSASSAGRDQGSTFTARLHTVPAPKPEVMPGPDHPPRQLRQRGRRILMVDDHEDTSRAMKRLLERLGYEVQTKHTVRDALDAVSASRFDLLISDIGLPDGSGVDLIRQLRQSANPIRALALSGFGMEEDVRRSKEAGFQDHLTKPVNFTRLQQVIAELMLEPTAAFVPSPGTPVEG
jgi:PAS domain S-box-containing protein